MTPRQPSLTLLPKIWLISDARNDTVLEAALAKLPRGSGFVFRHYHLGKAARRARFAALARRARMRQHVVALAGSRRQARVWGADIAYGPAGQLVPVHSLREIARVRRAAALLLSPVFSTRSHPGGKVLGPLRFRLLAARAPVPVIALGGMNAAAARRLKIGAWAAIDGLSPTSGRGSAPG